MRYKTEFGRHASLLAGRSADAVRNRWHRLKHLFTDAETGKPSSAGEGGACCGRDGKYALVRYGSRYQAVDQRYAKIDLQALSPEQKTSAFQRRRPALMWGVRKPGHGRPVCRTCHRLTWAG